jgi:hypothetical protein
MSFVEELRSDPETWPTIALYVWLMIAMVIVILRGGRWKETRIRRTMAGVAFGWIALKLATSLDFPLYERWMVMSFAYLGTVFLIDSIREG